MFYFETSTVTTIYVIELSPTRLLLHSLHSIHFPFVHNTCIVISRSLIYIYTTFVKVILVIKVILFVTNMVTQLGWDLLEHRRAKHRITVFYKIINNLANICMQHQLKVHDSSAHGTASHRFRQLNTKLNCYEYSFLPATIVLWNTLTFEVRQLPSLEQFQYAISQLSVS